MAEPGELEDESRRIRRVRLLVDLASSLIMQGTLGRLEAEALVGVVRRGVIGLFPGSEQTFDIIYGARFRRLMDEFALPDPRPSNLRATVVTFPGRSRS